MPDQLLQEKEIFNAARQIAAPEARMAYLQEACGQDPAAVHRVLELLRVFDQEKSFLESSPVAQATTLDDPITERPGTVIGRYKLLEEVGEGGMGTVWMAQQQEPVKRLVALKVIKPGMDSKQVLARFEAERQALALMEHPHIARVLDAGATANGRPYFVMELVKGVAITRYCDEHRLTPRERLELFIPVCQAIQHAHQKGIIHRDIKPSNVLVALYDGKPVPKVIDFGVAKATGPQLTEHTLVTGLGVVVGTLEYMSPEQAQLNQLDIDTRSDIYSLGVLLYELLTGTTPLERKRLKQGAMLEMLRRIREEESPRPSARLSDSKDSLPSISAQRHVEPAQLTKLVRGELDWIVMKALEKDRNRRYATANGLAADVQRYLNDEPVQACPPSSWYRLGKFWRRHRLGLALASVVAAALVVLVAGSLIWAVFLNEALHESESNRRRAEGAEKDATNAQRAATERLFGSLRDQAHASRFSRRMGQRFKSLEALKEAAKIARDLGSLPEHELDLRNEAIASLALLDLRVAREWDGWPADSMFIDFDPALERYARADRQGIVHIHRVADGGEIWKLPGFGPGNFGGGATEPYFSPDGRFLLLARGRWDQGSAIKVWSLSGPEPLQLPLQPPACTGFAFSPDGRELVVVQRNGAIHLYDLTSGRQLKQLQGAVKSLSCWLAFHPRARQLAIGHAAGIQVRDLETGAVLAELPQPGYHIAWHPNGQVLAVGGTDQMIHLWEVSTRKHLARLESRPSGGLTFTYNHAGDLLAGTGFDHILYLWDTRTGRQLFSTQTASAGPLRFSRDDQLLAAGIDVDNHKLRLWQLPRALAYRTLAGLREVNSGAISPKEPLLALGMNNGIGLWDLTSGAQVGLLNVAANYAIFEPSGALLASGLGQGAVHRWPIERDSAEPGLLRIGPQQKTALPSPWGHIATSKDGRVLVCAGLGVPGGRALVWHRDQPGLPLQLSFHDDSRYIDVSPDGQWVATGSHFGTKVKISAAQTQKLIHELPVEEGSLVRFSPDGRWLATTGGGCRLWAVDSWREGPHIGGYHGCPAFSPDGKLMAVESGQGAVRLVDPDTGREYARLEDPNQARAGPMCFTPDGRRLVIASGDSSSIQVWDLRLLRKQLAEINLDWVPAYPPAKGHEKRAIVRVQVDLNGTPKPSDYDKLIELYPKGTWGWSERASCYARLKQWDKAILDYDKVIELDPENASAWSQRGSYQQSLKQWDKALADYTQAMELIRKQWEKAIADEARAIEREPKNALLHNNLAWKLATHPNPAARDVGRALEWAKKAVELAPDNGWFWSTLGTVQYRAGAWDESIRALQKSLGLMGATIESWNTLFLAMAHWQRNDKEQARKWYDQAVTWTAKNKAGLSPRFQDELRRFHAEAAALLGLPHSEAAPE